MSNTSQHSELGGGHQVKLGASNGVSRSVVAFLVVIVGVVGFVLGTRSHELVAQARQLLGESSAPATIDLSSVQNTYRQLTSNFDGELDVDALIDGASRGLVQASGDDYTTFMDSDESEEFRQSLRGEVSGIGAEIGVRNDSPTVLRVIEGSPAQKSGVQPQDKILRVNDTVTTRFDAASTAEQIRGPAGTTVSLELLRGDETVKLSITRATISDPSVDSRLEGEVGIIKLRRFDKDTGSASRQAAERLLAQGATSIVLDMRDNGGGYLEQTAEVAGLWLDGEPVVSERRGDKKTDELRAKGSPILANTPTVVLVNGSSASASEIVAGALQDHEVATIIGEQTFGKGSVQKLIELSGGRLLKVTIARWYTPSGASISEKGITPDTEVELSAEDYNAGRDPQLQAAIDGLSK